MQEYSYQLHPDINHRSNIENEQRRSESMIFHFLLLAKMKGLDKYRLIYFHQAGEKSPKSKIDLFFYAPSSWVRGVKKKHTSLLLQTLLLETNKKKWASDGLTSIFQHHARGDGILFYIFSGSQRLKRKIMSKSKQCREKAPAFFHQIKNKGLIFFAFSV